MSIRPFDAPSAAGTESALSASALSQRGSIFHRRLGMRIFFMAHLSCRPLRHRGEQRALDASATSAETNRGRLSFTLAPLRGSRCGGQTPGSGTTRLLVHRGLHASPRRRLKRLRAGDAGAAFFQSSNLSRALRPRRQPARFANGTRSGLCQVPPARYRRGLGAAAAAKRRSRDVGGDCRCNVWHSTAPRTAGPSQGIVRVLRTSLTSISAHRGGR